MNDPRLFACPRCQIIFSEYEQNQLALLNQHKEEVVQELGKLIWRRHRRWLSVGFSIILAILTLAGYGVVQSLEKFRTVVVDRITAQFEEPQIRTTLTEVAENRASKIVEDQLNPAINEAKGTINSLQGELRQYVNDIKNRVENQSATIDLIAKQAIELSEDVKNRLVNIEKEATATAQQLETVTAQARAIEQSIKLTTEKMEAATVQARAAEQRLLVIEERYILRTWVNFLPNGDELLNSVTGANPGKEQMRFTVGPRHASDRPFKLIPGGNWDWTWDCDDDTLRKFTQFIEWRPLVPYARVARADCLKKRGDPSWRIDAERAKVVLEKMKDLHPHPKEIDDFYKVCLSLIQEPQ